jgi:hypothetical protein
MDRGMSIPAEAARIAELCKALSARAASIGWVEVVDALETLPVTLKEVRTREHLTVRDIEALTGVPFNSVSRFERGHDLYLSNALLLARWLAERGVSRDLSGGQPAAPDRP